MAGFGEPQHKIAEFVSEIAGRREQALGEMTEELTKLVTALVDQFAMLKKHNGSISLQSVKFARTRWVAEDGRGMLVMDISHAGRPLRPSDVRYW